MKNMKFKDILLNKKLLKVIVIILLFLVVVFSINKKTNFITSIAKIFYEDNPVDLDNWEISTVFYDSEVDGGNTPLTEINWDASDGGHGQLATRTITLQINYKNTNAVQDYEPESLSIKIPSPFKNAPNLYVKKVIGANNSTHVGYDWKVYWNSNPDVCIELLNAVKYEKNTNFEGSISIVYDIIPLQVNPTEYDEYKIDEFSSDCKAVLNNTIESNEVHFRYYRKHEYQWQKANFSISQSASRLGGMDYLPNPQDYYWIKYSIIVKDGVNYRSVSSYPYIFENDLYVEFFCPEHTIILDNNYNEIEKESGMIVLDKDHFAYNEQSTYIRYQVSIIVGYQKTDFINQPYAVDILNDVDLYVMYKTEDTYQYIGNSEISIDLEDYKYDERPYFLQKQGYEPLGLAQNFTKGLYYENLKGNKDLGCKGLFTTSLIVTARYYGYSYDLIAGEDLLMVTGSDGSYKALTDDEYYYSKISYPLQLNDSMGKEMPANLIDIFLYVRTKDNEEYELYDSFKNTSSESEQKIWTFTEDDGIVGYYFKFTDITYSILMESYEDKSINSTITIKSINDVQQDSGYLVGAGYLEVYKDGELLNPSNQYTYSDYLNVTGIREYDLSRYGVYRERHAERAYYSKYQIALPQNRYYALKSLKSLDVYHINENKNKEILYDGYKIEVSFQSDIEKYTDYEFNHLEELLDREYWNEGFEIYDLLPKGIEITSTEEEILNSLYFPIKTYKTRTFSGNDLTDYTYNEFKNYIKNRTTITIINNWNNTGRTMLKILIDFSDDPIMILSQTIQRLNIEFTYLWNISYDSLLTNGYSYHNRIRYKYHNKDVYDNSSDPYCPSDPYAYTYRVTDDGLINDNNEYVIEESDIDSDGDTLELFGLSRTTTTIPEVVSTNQDVQISVQSNNSNYSTGKVDVNNDTGYTYKLRARTGSNDITNLVIYDSIEKYAMYPNMELILASGGSNSWQGEFVGVDTSFAESKGYNVKVYYSENEQVGSLSEDNSWTEYNELVDKSKVKSLAFEYLDSDNQPAVLPANSLTYVLVNMESPADESITSLAYNGCWTEWNAIDSTSGETVDFITGINSNIVRVALPNSVEVEEKTITVDKYWVDNSNSLGVRPNSVRVKIIPNGDVTKASELIIDNTNVDPLDSNHWSNSKNVPKYDERDRLINYTIQEEEISLTNYTYSNTINNNTITNTLNYKKTINVNWIDNHNSYLTRPENVTINIKQNNNSYDSTVVTGTYSTDNWTKTVNLPVFDSSNNQYNYTFEQASISKYNTSYNETTNTFTNLLSETKNITVEKEWEDNDNEYSTRPNSITVSLLRNGSLLQDITISNTTWESEMISVPMYDSNGVKYDYTIQENNIDEYGLIEYDQNNYIITNTLKKRINLVIKKVWIDDDNANNTRPTQLDITLLRNGEDYQTIHLTGSTNEWTQTIKVDKYDDNQEIYTYSIKEVNDSILSDYSNVTYSEEELTVTNQLSRTTNLTISKKWLDNNNEYLTRPSRVLINLYQNNNLYREITLTNDNNWEYVVNDVPVYDTNGSKYIYTISEDESTTSNKYSLVTYDQTNLVVTNELTDPPKVTLYFTVVNGYIDPITKELKYDEYGFNEILKQYNINPNDEYVFEFKLENINTHQQYTGKLSTQGILQFNDIPYGDYKAVEGNDKLFDFVDMMGIEEVAGVSFNLVGNEGYISIKPTGEDIIYGTKIVNKIERFIENPQTGKPLILISVLLITISGIYIYKTKRKELYR